MLIRSARIPTKCGTPVTTPLLETVAIEVWLLDQAMTRPLRVLPDASASVAVSGIVCPIGTSDVAGDTVTLATGTCTTVTLAQPSTPSILAKTTVLPGFKAFTTPVLVTVATLGVLLDHKTVLPDRGWLLLLRACAVSVMIEPTAMTG